MYNILVFLLLLFLVIEIYIYGKTFFSAIYTNWKKFCDFFLASLDSEATPNGVYPETKEFAPRGANSFL